MRVIIAAPIVAAAGLDPGSFSNTSTRSRVVRSSRLDKTLARCARASPGAAACHRARRARAATDREVAPLAYCSRRRARPRRASSTTRVAACFPRSLRRFASRPERRAKSRRKSRSERRRPGAGPSFSPRRFRGLRKRALAASAGAGVGVSGGRFWSARFVLLRERGVALARAQREHGLPQRVSHGNHGSAAQIRVGPDERRRVDVALSALVEQDERVESFCWRHARGPPARRTRGIPAPAGRASSRWSSTRRHNRPTRMNTTRLDVVSASQWSASTTTGTKMPIARFERRARHKKVARAISEPKETP